MKYILLLLVLYSSSIGADQSGEFKKNIARYDLKSHLLTIPGVIVDGHTYYREVFFQKSNSWEYKNKSCYILIGYQLGKLIPNNITLSSFNTYYNFLVVPEILISDGSYRHNVRFRRVEGEGFLNSSCYVIESQNSDRKSPRTNI